MFSLIIQILSAIAAPVFNLLKKKTGKTDEIEAVADALENVLDTSTTTTDVSTDSTDSAEIANTELTDSKVRRMLAYILGRKKITIIIVSFLAAAIWNLAIAPNCGLPLIPVDVLANMITTLFGA